MPMPVLLVRQGEDMGGLKASPPIISDHASGNHTPTVAGTDGIPECRNPGSGRQRAGPGQPRLVVHGEGTYAYLVSHSRKCGTVGCLSPTGDIVASWLQRLLVAVNGTPLVGRHGEGGAANEEDGEHGEEIGVRDPLAQDETAERLRLRLPVKAIPIAGIVDQDIAST